MHYKDVMKAKGTIQALGARLWKGDLSLDHTPGTSGDNWVTDEPLRFSSFVSGKTYEVLSGLRTDGASIPRLAWLFTGPPLRSKFAPAALIHDALYSAQLTTRKEADLIFLEAMLSLSVNTFKARAMYRAVRMFGGGAWKGSTLNGRMYVRDRLKTGMLDRGSL